MAEMDVAGSDDVTLNEVHPIHETPNPIIIKFLLRTDRRCVGSQIDSEETPSSKNYQVIWYEGYHKNG